MNYLHWDSLGKHFYLVDTFRGLNERFISTEDKISGAVKKNASFRKVDLMSLVFPTLVAIHAVKP
jgi:hypothetical protein